MPKAHAVKKDQLQGCNAQGIFAANVKRVRQERYLTQEQLAELADLHPSYISSVERGTRNITICNIERLARALGVPMMELLRVSSAPDQKVD